MKTLLITILVTIISNNTVADNRLKTSNFDLRNSKKLLSIVDHKGVTSIIYKSVGDEYFYETQSKKDTSRFKVSNIDAQNFDDYFVNQFISLKYTLPNFSGKKCDKSYTLSMRGETQLICKSEKDKLSLIQKILKKITKLKK